MLFECGLSGLPPLCAWTVLPARQARTAHASRTGVWFFIAPTVRPNGDAHAAHNYQSCNESALGARPMSSCEPTAVRFPRSFTAYCLAVRARTEGKILALRDVRRIARAMLERWGA